MSREESQSKDGEKAGYYGTFPGPPSYPHHEPAIGFPQPVPPPGTAPPTAPPYYSQAYQAIPVAEGTPVDVRQHRLPCCGIGFGWFLYALVIIGFFLAAIPWYIGAFMLICVRRVDYREKPGYIACTIAAFLALIAVILGVTRGTHSW